MRVTLIEQPWDVRSRLLDLGLEEAPLLEAVGRGLASWANHTENHPRMLPALNAWGNTVAGLREVLIPRGWKKLEEDSLSLVVNADGTICIKVESGDEATGTSRNPETRMRGPRTLEEVEDNAAQLPLFDFFSDEESVVKDAEAPVNRNDREMWMLVVYRDLTAREVRAELSKPISFTEDGRVNGWAERIILRSTPFDGAQIDFGDDTGPVMPEIVIDVKRRG